MIIITILAFLFILAVCVTIHEFGHFIIAKLFRIPVEKFSIGFGPPIFKKKLGETDFRVAYFPLGGYVKMAGEEEGELLKPIKKEEPKPAPTMQTNQDRIIPGFYDVPIYRRIAVVLSGPIFNIISAFLIFCIIFIAFGIFVNPYLKVAVEKGGLGEKAGFLDGDSIVSVNGQNLKSWDEFWEIISHHKSKTATVKIKRNGNEIERQLTINIDSIGLEPVVPPVLGSLKLDGPAYKAGMQTGDRVLKINDEKINTWAELVEIVRISQGLTLKFDWQHNVEIKTAQITPIPFYDPISQDTVGQIGVMMPMVRNYLSLPRALAMAFKRTNEIIWLTLKTLYQLIIGKISRKALGGPIAIARLSGESARWGFENLLGLLSIISINLGVVNLFPIPALDGGQISIAIVEAIRRKRFHKKTRMTIQQIGYAILLLIIIFVTFNDLTR